MWGSVTSVFGDRDDFETAMQAAGYGDFTFTQGGRFRARLTEVTLQHMRLVSVEENLPRIAIIEVRKNMVMVGLSDECRKPPIWAGVSLQQGEIVTLGAGHGVHMRIEGPCHWGMVQLPTQQFTHYVEALTGQAASVPAAVCRWRPPASPGRQLRRLFAAAIQAARSQLRPIAGIEAARGLEQQLIHLLVQCVSTERPGMARLVASRDQDIMLQFEDLIWSRPEGPLRASDAAAALGISERVLRDLCAEQLGMSPETYLRLRKIKLAHRLLHRSAPQTVRIGEVAERFGFHDRGRFAKAYRQVCGELPSETLRYHWSKGIPEALTRGRSTPAQRRKII